MHFGSTVKFILHQLMDQPVGELLLLVAMRVSMEAMSLTSTTGNGRTGSAHVNCATGRQSTMCDLNVDWTRNMVRLVWHTATL